MKKVVFALLCAMALQSLVLAGEAVAEEAVVEEGALKGEEVSEDAITSASVNDYYGGISGDELMNAINSYSGFYAIASVNPDGTPNLAFFIYGCLKVEDTYYLQLGIAPNQTTANIENGSALMAMYGCAPGEEGYPTAGAKMELKKVEDEKILAVLLESAPEGFSPMYYEVTEVRPLG